MKKVIKSFVTTLKNPKPDENFRYSDLRIGLSGGLSYGLIGYLLLINGYKLGYLFCLVSICSFCGDGYFNNKYITFIDRWVATIAAFCLLSVPNTINQYLYIIISYIVGLIFIYKSRKCRYDSNFDCYFLYHNLWHISIFLVIPLIKNIKQ